MKGYIPIPEVTVMFPFFFLAKNLKLVFAVIFNNYEVIIISQANV